MADAGSRKMGISLKLSGGAALFFNGAGDLEKFRTSEMKWTDDLRIDSGYTTAFNWKKLSLIPDFNAKIILNITPNFGIGIGSGIINATSKGDYSYEGSHTWLDEWYGTDIETYTSKLNQNYKIQAIPITLNLYYFIPIGDSRKTNFYIYGGIGYYLGKLTHDLQIDHTDVDKFTSDYFWNETLDYRSSDTIKEESKQNKVGFKGGLGLEMNMTPSISVRFHFDL